MKALTFLAVNLQVSLIFCFGILNAMQAQASDLPVSLPGLRPDGSMLLPNQWSLRPAGKQIELGDFPVNIAIHPGSWFAAVLHCGYSRHEIIIVDLSAGTISSRANLAEAFYGLEFSHDGKRLFCSGSSGELVYVYPFDAGKLAEPEEIQLRGEAQRGVPAGLAIDSKGRNLFAANLWSDTVSRVNLASQTVDEIRLATNASFVQTDMAADEDADTAAATKRAKAASSPDVSGAAFPYDCVLNSSGDRLYVSLWGQASIAVIGARAGTLIDRWAAGEHPCELTLRRDNKFLFVANANDNTVSVIETKTGRTVERIWATLFPDSPRGATPNSLALSPDQKVLFVANANINAVAVFDVAKPGKSRCLGFIPTGWYPTSVRVTPDGKRLLIANGKGIKALANPGGPQPVKGRSNEQYIARLFRGTLSVIDLPSRKLLEQKLGQWTRETLACTPLRPDASVARLKPAGNPIPQKPGEPSPITHCIYIIKENRTYDQILGDMPEGNGDSELCIFPERVTPNHHQLARDFVLLDNFYVESEVSADGHEWTMGAYATDFVEKTWPLSYGHGRSGKFPYPSEGGLAIAAPASGYLWDRAREAGITYRSYGEFVQNGRANLPVTTRVKALQGHFDPWFRSFDLGYSDLKRAERFISELGRFEQEGEMPRLQIVRLPNDHTHGVTPGALKPTANLADNDLALGQIIEAISRSRFWTNTAVFVVEDDAQNGPDHVDAHRTVALVVSPYTRRHAVDSTMYSTSSMLRTMELILGLQPMTQFDAAATPMFNSFQAEPNFEPYVALPATVDMTETNDVASWGANIKFNLAKEDAADDLLFNEVIWRSVKGADQPMPAPVRAGFVLTRAVEDDD